MNKTFQKTILSAAVLAALLSGCKKPTDGTNGTNGTNGSTGPNLSGTLEGYVDLYDSYGDLMSNASGVYITIPGKTGTDSTTTAGIFTKSLTTGTYELDFSKTGYGQIKVPSLNFVGGGTQYINGHIQLTQAPNFTLSSATSGTATVQGLSVVSVTVTASSTDTKARKVICFFSSSASPTFANYTGSSIINIPANSLTGSGSIATATAYEAGVPSGTTINVSIYPISVANNASTYLDITSGKTIYNNINAASSVTTSTIVP